MARHVTQGYRLPKEEQRCTATLPSGDRCRKRRATRNDLYCHLHAHLTEES